MHIILTVSFIHSQENLGAWIITDVLPTNLNNLNTQCVYAFFFFMFARLPKPCKEPLPPQSDSLSGTCVGMETGRMPAS